MAAETADRPVGEGLTATFEALPLSLLHRRTGINPKEYAVATHLSARSVPKRTPAADMALERHLEEFLAKRDPPKTFCPSEVARALSAGEINDLGYSNWRDAMPGIRELAWSLRDRGECEILQKGEVLKEDVQLEDVRGPIRIRRTAS